MSYESLDEAYKLRAAELHDEALFQDPPAKEECPICFLPMPVGLMCCISLPPATITSIPVFDFECANRDSVNVATEEYYECCGKSICKGCIYSFIQSGNNEKCPYCKAERINKTDEERIEELMKRVDVNDANAIYLLGSYYSHGHLGLQQDQEKALELWTQAAKLGSSQAHFHLGNVYKGVDLKKEKFHYDAAAMAGNDVARNNLGSIEGNSGNMDRAMKHWIIAASAGNYHAMQTLRRIFEEGIGSRDVIDSTLTAYNNSCAEMSSEARDTYIRDFFFIMENAIIIQRRTNAAVDNSNTNCQSNDNNNVNMEDTFILPNCTNQPSPIRYCHVTNDDNDEQDFTSNTHNECITYIANEYYGCPVVNTNHTLPSRRMRKRLFIIFIDRCMKALNMKLEHYQQVRRYLIV